MNTFICEKLKVLEIATYQSHQHEGFQNEAKSIIEFINLQNETFGYESFMCKIPDFKSGKLHGHVGKFIRPFLLRMKAYKRGKNWIKDI